ncbi:MAG: biotin transporter BioY [Paracoccaceae bacterium]
MAVTMNDTVLAEAFGPREGTALRIKQVVLVILGIAVLAIAAKIKIAVPPSPVPIGMGTFAVLTIGAGYGPRLGLATILGYMIVGALGFDVFTSSTTELNGLTYMAGSTGGFLMGFVVATLVLGLLARLGWDRSVPKMALAMLIGSILLYASGLIWLSQWINAGGMLDTAKYGSLFGQTMAWGLTPYVIGDLMKLVLAALLLPALWKLVGKARA